MTQEQIETKIKNYLNWLHCEVPMIANYWLPILFNEQDVMNHQSWNESTLKQIQVVTLQFIIVIIVTRCGMIILQ